MKSPEAPDLIWEAPTPKLPKPPWWSRNKNDVEWMKAWVFERLKVRFAERLNKLYAELKARGGIEFDPETHRGTIVHRTLQDMKDAAEQGNMEPLREAYPELAEYLHPRKRKPGERRFSRDLELDDAVEDVHFIRQLWKREYGGRWKRRQPNADDANPQGNPPFAEEIAAEFHHVDATEVRSRAGKNFARKSKI